MSTIKLSSHKQKRITFSQGPNGRMNTFPALWREELGNTDRHCSFSIAHRKWKSIGGSCHEHFDEASEGKNANCEIKVFLTHV